MYYIKCIRRKIILLTLFISLFFTSSIKSYSLVYALESEIIGVNPKDDDGTSVVTIEYINQTRAFKFVTKNGEEVIKRGGKYWKLSDVENLIYDRNENKWYSNENGVKTYPELNSLDSNFVIITPNSNEAKGITNILEGSLNENSLDAINGSQLRDAKKEIANILGGSVDEIGNLIGPTYTVQDKKYTNIYEVVKAIDKKLSEIPSFDAGIAGAIATANLPQVISTDRPYLVGVGTGFYNGAAAISVGMSGVNKKGTVVFKFNGSINTQGQLGAGAGIGYTFGNTYEEKEEVVRKQPVEEKGKYITDEQMEEILKKSRLDAQNEMIDLLDKMQVLTKDNAKDLFKDELEKTKNELKIIISQNSGMNNENEWETVEKEIHLDGALPFTCDLEIGRCVIYGFEVDSPKTNSKEEEAIKGIVKALNERIEKASMTVVGHTDYVASEEYNQILGRQRAIAVMRLLKKYGLKEEIYFRNVESASEYLPLDNSKDKYARYINRRVELYLDGLILQRKDIKGINK